MERRPEDLTGMSVSEAKEYIIQHITSYKLMEKKRKELEEAFVTWTGRIERAQKAGSEALIVEATQQAQQIQNELNSLTAEMNELSRQIESMKRQLPTLPAKERSIDPDMLEQELRLATGKLLDDDMNTAVDAAMANLEKQQSVEQELQKLKKRLGLDTSTPSTDEENTGK